LCYLASLNNNPIKGRKVEILIKKQENPSQIPIFPIFCLSDYLRILACLDVAKSKVSTFQLVYSL